MVRRGLEGLLVISLEQAVAAPLASRLLADAGARVIKVERPEGDFARYYDDFVCGESVHFIWLNAGKESIALDLKREEERALLMRMLARADVFLHNLGPGVAERLGLGSAQLRRRFPRLVICEISGYGDLGPYRGMKAYDLLVQAESGIAYVTGVGEEPARVGVSVADIGGGMEAYAGVLRALFARTRDGRGRTVQVSLFHAMGEWMNVPYLTFRHTGRTPPRLGLHHPTIAPYGAYACREGRRVLLAVQNAREWERLCRQVLGRPELARDPRFSDNVRRLEHRAALDAVIHEVFAGLDREEVVRRLEDARIAYARLSSLEDLCRHPQRRLRRVVLERGGEVEILARGAWFTDEGDAEPRRVPALDEQGPRLRAEFGAREIRDSGEEGEEA